MTAPAEDPRSGEVCRCGLPAGSPVHGNPFGAGHTYDPRPPAAGRGDTDGSGERDDREPKPCPQCGQTCTYDGWGHVHPGGLGIGSCRPAVDRAEPPEGLREAIAQAVWEAVDGYMSGVPWERAKAHDFQAAKAYARADAVLALPAVAALLDAQAAVGRVEELAATWEARSRSYGAADDRDKVTELRQRAAALRRALGGPS